MKITIPFAVKDANIISSNVVENDYSPFSLTATYSLGERVIVTGVDIHQIYQSVHGITGAYPLGNIGNNPLAELDLNNPVHWSLVGATNAYKMFDTYISSQTVNTDSITFQVKDLGILNTIGLINIDAAQATLLGLDSLGNTIYNQTKTLTSFITLSSYYDYYFSPFLRKNFCIFEDIPPVKDGVFTITITGVGAVKLGAFVGGYAYDMAAINYSSNVRQKDFSIKQQLVSGEYYFAPGEASTIADLYFTLPNGKFDLLQRLIYQLRATPALYIGSTLYESTTLFGIVLDAPSELSYVNDSECRMQIESLI